MREAIVIGVSAGGLNALKTILPELEADFPVPIAIVQHLAANSDAFAVEFLDRICHLPVKEAEDKEPLKPGYIYFAPAGYHLLIEPDRSFSLSVDEKIHYCRPAIDPLFESAAEAYGSALTAVVLTGANADGAQGIKAVKDARGIVIIQDPRTAENPAMPKAALEAAIPDYVLPLENIAPLLKKLCCPWKETRHARSQA